MPTTDEKFQPLDILKYAVEDYPGLYIIHETQNPFETPESTRFTDNLRELGIESRIRSDNPNIYTRELVHPDGTRYIFTLSTSTEEQKGKVTVGDDVLDLDLGPRVAEVYSINGLGKAKIFSSAIFS